jgi:2-dehydro-3-deoxygalactonokinase
MSAATPAMIAVDWGTTNFRAFLLSQSGEILDRVFARSGLQNIRGQKFEELLMKETLSWRNAHKNLPILMSGMVGSRKAWLEVPYLECPVELNQFGHHLSAVGERANQWIVPGVSVARDNASFDVMRGEEVQILGTVDPASNDSRLICLPGTHSKWALVEDGKISNFKTYMTGELFVVLRKYSILGHLMTSAKPDDQGFAQGYAWGKRPESFLSQIFQTRTQVLAGNLSPKAADSFLSGLLISEEIKAGLSDIEVPNKSITIIANPRIAQQYAKCLAEYDIEAVVMNSDEVTTKGLFQVAQQAKLV